MVLAIGLSVHQRDESSGAGLAGEAVVSASSTSRGFSARELVTSGSATAPGAGWESAGETTGAWVELAWTEARALRRLTLVRGSLAEPGPTHGFLSFGDGSHLQFSLSPTSRVTEIVFSPRRVDRVRLTITAVQPEATSVALAEILASAAAAPDDVVLDDVADGNAARSAAVSQSADVGSADPQTLVDGAGTPDAAGAGQTWTADRSTGAWVELGWSAPRELTTIAVVGADGSSGRPSELTLHFDDGTRLPVGEVLADSTRPTVLSFMPRVTSRVRLTIDGVTGAGPLTLGEVRAYQRGAAAPRPVRTGNPSEPAPANCPARPPGPTAAGMTVRCPLAGSAVSGPSVELEVSAAGYAEVEATAWPADGSAPAGRTVRSRVGSTGIARIVVDLSQVPPGPLTVEVEASGFGRAATRSLLGLYRGQDDAAEGVASSAPAGGRTLVYADEFTGPLSVTRTGAGADYAAGKPTHAATEDFGEAIFADPALGLGNLSVVDNSYLRIAVQPKPPDLADPQGWNRTRTSGLLAGARQGGSGFSAQYGYFEARMLAPAGRGTWPAFWLLPSDNLVRPQPAVAEIDAVELYGHEPTGACHSTHEYIERRDGGVARCGRRFPDDRTALAWHTYGVSVTPSEIIFFIDGRRVATSPQVEGGGAPMFLLVNLALGGGWPIALEPVQDRAVLYVDHIRVYV